MCKMVYGHHCWILTPTEYLPESIADIKPDDQCQTVLPYMVEGVWLTDCLFT